MSCGVRVSSTVAVHGNLTIRRTRWKGFEALSSQGGIMSRIDSTIMSESKLASEIPVVDVRNDSQT